MSSSRAGLAAKALRAILSPGVVVARADSRAPTHTLLRQPRLFRDCDHDSFITARCVMPCSSLCDAPFPQQRFLVPQVGYVLARQSMRRSRRTRSTRSVAGVSHNASRSVAPVGLASTADGEGTVTTLAQTPLHTNATPHHLSPPGPPAVLEDAGFKDTDPDITSVGVPSVGGAAAANRRLEALYKFNTTRVQAYGKAADGHIITGSAPIFSTTRSAPTRQAAVQLHSALSVQWTDGVLHLAKPEGRTTKITIRGFSTYEATVEKHNPQLQLENTLLIEDGVQHEGCCEALAGYRTLWNAAAAEVHLLCVSIYSHTLFQ